MKNKIVDFIKNNKLKFSKGRRNSDSVILSGYALSIGFGLLDMNELIKIIQETCKKHEDIEEEFERVFTYASLNNYKLFWTTETAKKQYIF